MLAQLLIAYTHDFDAALTRELERESGLEPVPSLAMWANVLRFVGDDGIDLRQISEHSGIAQQTIKSMVACLHRHRWVSVDGANVVRLTERGACARRAWPAALEAVEREWEVAVGAEVVAALRSALETCSHKHGRKLPSYPMPAAHRGALPTGE